MLQDNYKKGRKMIYTLTTNPAIDMNVYSDGLKEKQVNRTFGSVYTPNGKGLNVSFVLDHFGVPSKIMGFFGGFSGDYIVEESQKKGFEVVPVWVDDITRINIFLNDGNTEYKFVNEGAFVNKSKQKELLQKIEEIHDMEYLAISGSLPKGVETDYYDEIFNICQKKGIEVILDVSSPKLADLLKYHPLRDLVRSRGLGDVYKRKALAAFLSIWLKDKAKIEEALKNSAATGANVAESNAIGTLEKVDEYRNNIQVRKVK